MVCSIIHQYLEYFTIDKKGTDWECAKGTVYLVSLHVVGFSGFISNNINNYATITFQKMFT